MRANRGTFYRIRQERSRGRFKYAAEFIYLNKTCWNGLYRVNANGEFNVPYGLPKSKGIADLENLRCCSRELSKPTVNLRIGDFAEGLHGVRKGDLVYLDPPYVTRHNNNGFIDYNEVLFSWDDQERLAELATTLAKKGARVLVTNANHRDILDLYSGFSIRRIRRSSTIASNARFRGSVTEVLFSS